MDLLNRISEKRIEMFLEELLKIEREFKDKSIQVRKEKISLALNKLWSEIRIKDQK